MVMRDELIGHLLKYKHVDEHRAKVKQYWAHMRQYSTWGPSCPAAADGVHYALFLSGDGATFSMNEKLTMVYTGLIITGRPQELNTGSHAVVPDPRCTRTATPAKPETQNPVNPKPKTVHPKHSTPKPLTLTPPTPKPSQTLHP